jgi:hypothetical protein
MNLYIHQLQLNDCSIDANHRKGRIGKMATKKAAKKAAAKKAPAKKAAKKAAKKK